MCTLYLRLLCTFEKSLERSFFCGVIITDFSLTSQGFCFLQSSQQQLFLRQYSTWTWCCKKLRTYVSLEHYVCFSFLIPFVGDLSREQGIVMMIRCFSKLQISLFATSKNKNVPRHVQTSGVQSINRTNTKQFGKSVKPSDLVRRSFQIHTSFCEHQLLCKREQQCARLVCQAD